MQERDDGENACLVVAVVNLFDGHLVPVRGGRDQIQGGMQCLAVCEIVSTPRRNER